MSYDKAMRHTLRKSKKQSTMHFGFDTGSEWKNVRRCGYMAAVLEIRLWMKHRHDGDKAYNRECIREAIQRCRVEKENFVAPAIL